MEVNILPDLPNLILQLIATLIFLVIPVCVFVCIYFLLRSLKKKDSVIEDLNRRIKDLEDTINKS